MPRMTFPCMCRLCQETTYSCVLYSSRRADLLHNCCFSKSVICANKRKNGFQIKPGGEETEHRDASVFTLTSARPRRRAADELFERQEGQIKMMADLLKQVDLMMLTDARRRRQPALRLKSTSAAQLRKHSTSNLFMELQVQHEVQPLEIKEEDFHLLSVC